MPYKDPAKRRAVARKISREWAKQNPEKMREYWRSYYYRNKAKQQANHKDWLARNPEYIHSYQAANQEKIATYQRKWQSANKDKVLNRARQARIRRPGEHAARNALNGAIRSGKMIKPSHCSNCGEQRKLQGHHHLGYDKEHYLSVVWLCVRCHENVHHR